jgi:iron-sulfur cluster repair protein YtfE (RIC family)
MNRNRRKQLKDICKRLEIIKDELDNVMSDEQDCFDNMPENLQGSARGQDSEEAIEQMEDAIDQLDEAINSIEEII